jgi:hypothetical protein
MTDQEEFRALLKRLSELADKMGQRITIVMRRKRDAAPAKPQQREPGDE